MALSRLSWRDWLVRRVWRGPTWEYTILVVHHLVYRDGSAPHLFEHSVVMLRDGVVQATIRHTEVADLSADQRVQSTWFERYLPGLLDDLGREGWRIVSFSWGSSIRVVFARRR